MARSDRTTRASFRREGSGLTRSLKKPLAGPGKTNRKVIVNDASSATACGVAASSPFCTSSLIPCRCPSFADHRRMAESGSVPQGLDRRAANDAAVQQFFAAWDPYWRWTLVLGLRDLRANADRLGRLASERTGQASWSDENYEFGPLVLGLTAAAVNETHSTRRICLLSYRSSGNQATSSGE